VKCPNAWFTCELFASMVLWRLQITKATSNQSSTSAHADGLEKTYTKLMDTCMIASKGRVFSSDWLVYLLTFLLFIVLS